MRRRNRDAGKAIVGKENGKIVSEFATIILGLQVSSKNTGSDSLV